MANRIVCVALTQCLPNIVIIVANRLVWIRDKWAMTDNIGMLLTIVFRAVLAGKQQNLYTTNLLKVNEICPVHLFAHVYNCLR